MLSFLLTLILYDEFDDNCYNADIGIFLFTQVLLSFNTFLPLLSLSLFFPYFVVVFLTVHNIQSCLHYTECSGTCELLIVNF